MIVVTYNMPRALRRTMYSLSRHYQRNLPAEPYEVIVVDNGSDPAVASRDVRPFGREFSLLTVKQPTRSPVRAINEAVRSSSGRYVGVMLDGARMVTPGTLGALAAGTTYSERPFVSLLAWHLGPEHQSRSILHGFDEEAEDRLLQSVDWRRDGYALFGISSLESSNPAGWFGPIAESTCFVTSREVFEDLSGFDERFESAGGGLTNHDLLRRVASLDGVQIVVALGEGTFHQLHGGVSTNSPVDRWPEFESEYVAVTGLPYSVPEVDPLWIGRVGAWATRWVGSASNVHELISGREDLSRHAAAVEIELARVREALRAADMTVAVLRSEAVGRSIPLAGAQAVGRPDGLFDDLLVGPACTLVCVVLRDADSFVLDGWMPTDIVGEGVLEVSVGESTRCFAVRDGFFLIELPLLARANDELTIQINCKWQFGPTMLSELETRVLSWRLIGLRFASSSLRESDEFKQP